MDEIIHDAVALGSLVKERRKTLGYTQAKVAALCGTGTRFISDMENGKETIEIGKALIVFIRSRHRPDSRGYEAQRREVDRKAVRSSRRLARNDFRSRRGFSLFRGVCETTEGARPFPVAACTNERVFARAGDAPFSPACCLTENFENESRTLFTFRRPRPCGCWRRSEANAPVPSA